MKIKILLADDHALMRDAVRHIVQSAGDMEIAGEAWDESTTVEVVQFATADILVLDLSMPGHCGLKLIERIRKQQPSLRIIVLTMHAAQHNAARAFKAGASAYLTKDSTSDELLCAVRKVAAGEVFLSLRLAERFAEYASVQPESMPHEQLTAREFEIFREIVAGRSANEIANHLSLSPKTVSTHKTHILEKLDLPNEISLIRYALRHQLFEDGL